MGEHWDYRHNIFLSSKTSILKYLPTTHYILNTKDALLTQVTGNAQTYPQTSSAGQLRTANVQWILTHTPTQTPSPLPSLQTVIESLCP